MIIGEGVQIPKLGVLQHRVSWINAGIIQYGFPLKDCGNDGGGVWPRGWCCMDLLGGRVPDVSDLVERGRDRFTYLSLKL